jgi:hypothetical protein
MVILDLTGKVVKSISNGNFSSIDISALTQGVYLLNISIENGVIAKHFVKQ